MVETISTGAMAMADMASIEYTQATCVSRHVKPTMFHRELFEWLQFPKFRLPLDSASGRRGSRGATPLHWAAGNGHVSAVERLIEAKATVDAKDKNGRGLGTKGLGGKPS